MNSVNRHLSFYTPTPFDECAKRLNSRSQTPEYGRYLFRSTHIFIQAISIAPDTYSLHMEARIGRYALASLHGTLQRTSDKTLVQATATMKNNVYLTLWMLFIVGLAWITNPNLSVWLSALILASVVALYYLVKGREARNELCFRLEEIVGSDYG
jgi:hypothetical protein